MSNGDTDRRGRTLLGRELSTGLNALTNQCVLGRLYVRQWRALATVRTKHPVMDETPSIFFKLTSVAFASQVLAISSRLVERRHKRGREPASVYWLLSFVKEHADVCSPDHPELVRDAVQEDRRKLQEAEGAIGSLRLIRNNYVAHNDLSRILTESTLDADRRFGPDDAEGLLRTIGDILNRYSCYLQNSGRCMDLCIGETTTGSLLDLLAKSLEAANTREPERLGRLLEEIYRLSQLGLVIRASDAGR